MGNNPRSLLSPGQIAQKVYDEVNDRIRVEGQYNATLSGDLEIAIDSKEDSVTIGDDAGNHTTTTTVGPKTALDVNVVASSGGGITKIQGNTDGTLIGNNTNRLLVDGSTVTQPISGTIAVSNFPITQPVSGTVTVIQPTGTNLHVGVDNFPATQPISAASLPLPTGASTSALQTTANTSLSTIVTSLSSPLVTVGAAATSSGSVASNGNAIADGPLLSKYSNVSVMVYGTFNATITFMGSNDGTNYFAVAGESIGNPSTTPNTNWTVPGIYNVPIKFIFFEVVISNYVSGTINVVTQYQSISPITVNRAGPKSGISAVTSVNGSASNVSLLVSNTLRKAAYFFNDSTSVAFVKLGTTASATSYTVRMVPLSFVTIDLDPAYTGEVDCIWATANGAMRVTELT